MSQALYRKWRPHQWDEVVSQEHVVQTLRNAVRTGRTGHAYLLAGPRGTGKTTTARLLAKALNCLAEDTALRPCDACEHCQSINAGRFMDLIEIDAASNTSVDDVRALRDKINFSPTQGRYKVYIIDEVHMLSTAAFNALLKTLEEPPPHAIFILATTEIYKIPPTVLSRCQRYEFRRIPVSDIVQYLREKASAEGLSVEDEALTLIARQATGAMRDAISLLDQLASTGSRVTLAEAQTVLGTATSAMVVELIEAVLARDAAKGLQMVQSALDAGTDARQFARQVVDYLRSLLLVRMGSSDSVDVTVEMRAAMARHAQEFDTPRLLETIRLFNNAAVDTRSSWHPGLGLELALAEAIEEKAAPVQPASSVSIGAARESSTPAVPTHQPAAPEPTPARPGVDQGRIAAARAASASAPATSPASKPPAAGQSAAKPSTPAQPGASTAPGGAHREAPAPEPSTPQPPAAQPPAKSQPAAKNQPPARPPVEEDDADMPEMPPFEPFDEEFMGGAPAAGPARSNDRPAQPPARANTPAAGAPASTPRREPADQPAAKNQPPASKPGASQPAPTTAKPAARGASTTQPAPATGQPPAARPAQGQPAAKPQAGQSQPPAAPGRAVTQQEIQQNWPRVRQMVKSKNSLTAAALNSCRSVLLKDNLLILGFSSEVVKSKMETNENIDLLRQSIQAILGVSLAIRCVVTSAHGGTAGDANVDGDGMVGTALDLGGKIVYEE